MNCATIACVSAETRRYLNGFYCPAHTPAALACRPEPDTQVDPLLTDKARRIMHTPDRAKGGTDLNKERPGGYVSRQGAVKIANHQRPRQA